MAAKPENNFIRSIHKLLPNVFHEKTNNPFRAGMPDVWYSGDKGDMWIEYKFVQRPSKTAKILPNLTPRQARWLNDRCDEGRDVYVVLGTPSGGVIYQNKEWNEPLLPDEFQARLQSKKAIAAWISDQVGDRKCSSLESLL